MPYGEGDNTFASFKKQGKIILSSLSWSEMQAHSLDCVIADGLPAQEAEPVI